MRKILLAILFVGVMAGSVSAQTTIAVDIAKAKLAWDWTQGTGGVPTEFRVKCGAASGVYTKITTIADPAARSANIRDVITGSGNWFCAVSAANQFGESANSNEVFFAAGAAPLAPTNARVSAQ